MDDHGHEVAYRQWLASLRTLTSDPTGLKRWQDQRYLFAHQVGTLLVGAHEAVPAVQGPALYGVFIPGTGLCYVGQTQRAERRLRDLPIGESHHLPTTLPAELWERVIVLSWPVLMQQVPAEERQIATEVGEEITGLALEYAVQTATAPPINSRKRQSDGTWRSRNLAQSSSRGALQAERLPQLTALVTDAWQHLATVPALEHSSVLPFTHGRAVFPSALGLVSPAVGGPEPMH